MPKPTYWFWEGELSPNECQSFIDKYFLPAHPEVGVIDSDVNRPGIHNEEIRKSSIVWVHPGADLFDLVFTYIKEANKKVWNYDISGMESVQLGKYSDGGHYEWHVDSDEVSPDGYERKLSCSIQLSNEDSYVGGDLMFKIPMAEYTAPRKQGTIVVFPSALWHKVTPVTEGTRFSAVSWMRGLAFK